MRVKNTAWKTHGKANLATRCELELAAGVCVSNKELGLKHRTNQLLSPNLIMSRRIWAKKKCNFAFCSRSGEIKGTQAFMTLTLTQITALRGQKTEQSHSCCFLFFSLLRRSLRGIKLGLFLHRQQHARQVNIPPLGAGPTSSWHHQWKGRRVFCNVFEGWHLKPALLSANSSHKTTNSTTQAATQQAAKEEGLLSP